MLRTGCASLARTRFSQNHTPPSGYGKNWSNSSMKSRRLSPLFAIAKSGLRRRDFIEELLQFFPYPDGGVWFCEKRVRAKLAQPVRSIRIGRSGDHHDRHTC